MYIFLKHLCHAVDICCYSAIVNVNVNVAPELPQTETLGLHCAHAEPRRGRERRSKHHYPKDSD